MSAEWVGPAADSDPADWSRNVCEQVVDTMLGECIGTGIGRAVFEVAFNEHIVAKVENRARSFQNVAEWLLWQDVADTAARKWFAPCHGISASGIVLIQARTDPIPRDRKVKVPDWFTDNKRANFGLYEGRVVCHDYGYLQMPAFAARPKLVPVED